MSKFPLLLLLATAAVAFSGCNHITIDDVSRVQGEPVKEFTIDCGEVSFTLDQKGLRGVINGRTPLSVSGELLVDNDLLYARLKFDGTKVVSNHRASIDVDYEGLMYVNLEEPRQSHGYVITTFGGMYRMGNDKLHGTSCATSPQLKKEGLDRVKRGEGRSGD
jgi:hypothetical protein